LPIWGHPTTNSPAPKRLHLACWRKRVECPLHGALAASKRKRQGRARPRLAVGEEGEHCRVLLFDARRQHDDLACAARRQRKTSLRRAHVGQRPKRSEEHTSELQSLAYLV